MFKKLLVVAALLVPLPALANVSQNREIECLARAVYFEARGEGERGMRAVAHVVMNRVSNEAFPNTICGVVNQRRVAGRCQFSFVCEGKMRRPVSGEAWEYSRRIAYSVYHGNPDITDGALYFHARRVRPSWRLSFEEVAEDFGNHRFYR